MNKAVWGIIAALLLLGAVVFYEIFVWRDCLHDHSVFFCLRVLA